MAVFVLVMTLVQTCCCWKQLTAKSRLLFVNVLLIPGPKNTQARCRSRHSKCSEEGGVLENFAKFTGQHLYQSLFLNKVAGLSLQRYLKRDSGVLL